ncbi:cupin-like domain-containing protein [Lysobacter niastensis]|uniref:Cupin-like domain-containing protein n=1 Tax=Lysobacter niastensis TaxID=380629 RepID=A0ABS0B5U0_9GAMM|nr:cupin-like domain-containing protein [Lysobacter niastensis]MBF6024298.1 cupin-like domain-containing protein [Lysobacter niastensis]
MALTVPKPVALAKDEHQRLVPQIEFDPAAFDPWRIQPVRHLLSDHPLLQLEALTALGARLEAAGRIRTHANDATAGTPFNNAPDLHPNTRSAVDTLSSLREAKAWTSLLNVQTDSVYRELVGMVLDSVQPLVEQRDPGMCHRAGWIFVSSPRTVTPFHFDKEHNFILQIHGRKRVYVWDHRDTVVASELARDRFHQRHDRDQLQWKESFRERAQVFDLLPGQGAYMPSTSPHMVENGDDPSITISFTYYTDSTRRDAMLHKTHAVLRDLGVTLPEVGRWPLLDGATAVGVQSALALRALAARLTGRAGAPGYARFAQVGM